MRIPFATKLKKSLLNDLHEHIDKAKECAWVFQQAVECYIADNCDDFSEFRQKAIQIEKDAAVFNNRLYQYSPKNSRQALYKSIIIRCLKEQNRILTSIISALAWISFRDGKYLPQELEKDFFLFIDLVIEPIEELHQVVFDAQSLILKNSKKQRKIINGRICSLIEKVNETNRIEVLFKKKLFGLNADPVNLFHMIRLAELVGAIAGHGKNAVENILELISY